MKRIDKYKKDCKICLIISLLIHIILFQVVRTNKHSIAQYQTNQVIIEVIQIPQTFQKIKINRPIEPTCPTVPIPMESEYIPKDCVIIPTILDFSDILPPEPEPPTDYDYENYSFIPFQIPPSIIGGTRLIKNKLRYPPICKRIGLEGRTIIAFLINKKGRWVKCFVKVSSGFDSFDKEALRVAKTIRFTPALQFDKPVKVWVAIPFVFKLQ